jgi:hypothetical protein
LTQKIRGSVVEAWVKKDEVENPMSLFGPGRGFTIGPDRPKIFKIGRREDLEHLAQSNLSQKESPITLYLY